MPPLPPCRFFHHAVPSTMPHRLSYCNALCSLLNAVDLVLRRFSHLFCPAIASPLLSPAHVPYLTLRANLLVPSSLPGSPPSYSVRYADWAATLAAAFERQFWVPRNAGDDAQYTINPAHVHRRGMYKVRACGRGGAPISPQRILAFLWTFTWTWCLRLSLSCCCGAAALRCIFHGHTLAMSCRSCEAQFAPVGGVGFGHLLAGDDISREACGTA